MTAPMALDIHHHYLVLPCPSLIGLARRVSERLDLELTFDQSDFSDARCSKHQSPPSLICGFGFALSFPLAWSTLDQFVRSVLHSLD